MYSSLFLSWDSVTSLIILDFKIPLMLMNNVSVIIAHVHVCLSADMSTYNSTKVHV